MKAMIPIIGILLLPGIVIADFEIVWQTIDGGGGMSSGGPYTLTGTIWQADTGVSSAGYLTINNDPIILAMFNAIKELKTENDQLHDENQQIRQQLKEENQGLKQKLERLELAVTQLTQSQSNSHNF